MMCYTHTHKEYLSTVPWDMYPAPVTSLTLDMYNSENKV